MITYIKGGETVNSRMASAEGFLVAGFPSAAPLLQSLMTWTGGRILRPEIERALLIRKVLHHPALLASSGGFHAELTA